MNKCYSRILSGFLLISLSVLVSCSVTNKALNVVGLGKNNDIKKISVEASFNSNLDTAVAIDLLFIYDDAITPVLSELTGPGWFQDRDALIKRYSNDVDVVSLEVVPLSVIDKVSLPANHKKAKNVLMFANYRSPKGQYVAALGQFVSLKIRLLNDQYQLEEEGKK